MRQKAQADAQACRAQASRGYAGFLASLAWLGTRAAPRRAARTLSLGEATHFSLRPDTSPLSASLRCSLRCAPTACLLALYEIAVAATCSSG